MKIQSPRSSNGANGATRSILLDALPGMVAMILLALSAPAANFTTAVQEPGGNDWNVNGGVPLWQPGSVLPTAGNTYEVVAGGNPSRIRNPVTTAGAIHTFPGDQFTLHPDTEIRTKTAGGCTIDFPGVGGAPGLVFLGNNMDAGDDGIFTITGVAEVRGGVNFENGTTTTTVRGWVLNCEIRGSSLITLGSPGSGGFSTAGPPLVVASANNPFSGGWNIHRGALHGTGVGSLGSGNIMIAPGATLEVDYDVNTPGSLTLVHTDSAGSASVFILHQNCTFGSALINRVQLAAGTYTWAQLNAEFPANFPAGGSGSITVMSGLAPAPASVLDGFVQMGGNRTGYVEASGKQQDGGSYIVIDAGGQDQWDNADEDSFAYHQIAGDFDIRVQMPSIWRDPTSAGCCPKVALAVRESLAEDARRVILEKGSQNVNDNFEFLWRTGVQDVNGHNGGVNSSGAGSFGFPSAWSRLVRQGSVISGYISRDGVNWTQLGASQDTTAWAGNVPMNNRVFVGLAVSPHTVALGQTIRSAFQNYSEMNAPTFYMGGADSFGQSEMIRVFFSHPIDMTTVDPFAGNFTVDGLFIARAVAGPAPNIVDLLVDSIFQMSEGSPYSVTVGAIPGFPCLDTSGNPVDPARSTAGFVHGEGYELAPIHLGANDPFGSIGDENGYPNSVAYSSGSPSWIDGVAGKWHSVPAMHDSILGTPEGPGTLNDYNTRILGVLNITTAGNYQFGLMNDDGSRLYLSSNDQPASESQIGAQGCCAGDFGAGFKTAPQALAPGRYLLDYEYHEGGGGHYGGVTWDAGTGTPIVAANVPIDASQFIPSRFYLGHIFYTLGPAFFRAGPADVHGTAYLPVTFSVSVDGTPPYTFIWKINGVVDPYAPNAPDWTFTPTAAQDGLKVSCCVSNMGGGACTSDATLSLILNTVATKASSQGDCHAIYVDYTQPMNLNGTYTVLCRNTIPGPGTSIHSADFTAGDGGYTVQTPQAYNGPWVYDSGLGAWTEAGQDLDNGHANISLLQSPAISVTQSGLLSLSFAHRHSFECESTSDYWDGGQVRLSVNGGPFITVPASAFTQNGYEGVIQCSSGSTINNQAAFVCDSANYAAGYMTSTCTLGAFSAGDSIQVEFMAASDSNTAGANQPNWQIGNVDVSVSPLVVTPIVVTSLSHGATANQVVLHVSPDLLPDTNQYIVDIAGATSTFGLPVTPGASVSFVHGSEYPSFNVLYRKFNGLGNQQPETFMANPKYVNNQFNELRIMPGFETAFCQDYDDNYGAEFNGFWVVPQTGTYRFWTSSDDYSRTYMATDAIPGHKVQITSEPQWANWRAYCTARDAANGLNTSRGTPPANMSAPIPLTAGQLVYLQGDFTEGGGGDHYAATYVIDSDTCPGDGAATTLVTNQFKTMRVSPDGTFFTTLCDVFCNPGPSDQISYATRRATFNAIPDGTPPYQFQWYSNGVAIAGATAQTYITAPLAAANDQDVYMVALSNYFSFSSCSAKVTVAPNPIVLSVTTKGDPGHIYVQFNKPVALPVSGDPADQYALSGGLSPLYILEGIAYGSSHSEVVIAVTSFTPLAPDQTYTLVVGDTSVVPQTVVSEDGHPLVPPFAWVFGQPQAAFCTSFAGGVLPGTVANNSVANGGVATPPYLDGADQLHMTDALNGQFNYWTIPFPATETLMALDLKWSNLLAPGTGGIGNSADGLSVSVGTDISPTFDCAEPTFPGLSVTVDTYNNGAIAQNNNTANETGIEIRWNGSRIAFTPIGGTPAGSVNGPAELMKNRYVNAQLTVDPSGKAVFTYDTYVVSAQIPNFSGINANQYVFASRTGGANESHLINNVCINSYTPGPISVAVTPSPASPVAKLSQVTFTATPSGSIPYYFQWLKAGVPIPGATAATYTTPPLDCADAVTYSVVVSNLFSSDSAASTVSFIVPPGPPVITGVSSEGGCYVHVTFDQAVDPATALAAASYTIPGTTVVPAGSYIQPDGRTVVLQVSPCLVGAFTVTATGVREHCPSLAPTSSTVGSVVIPVCRGWTFAKNFDYTPADSGRAAMLVYGNTIALLTNNPAYPNSPTDSGYYIGANRPERNAANNHTNDGCYMKGYLLPTETGNYIMGNLSDDASQVFMNTNALTSEDLLYATNLVANQVGCCAVLVGSTVHLEAGRRYAFYALQENGTGGDYLQVQWETPSLAMALIPGAQVAVAADPGTTTLSVTTQPTPLTQTAAVNTPVSFTMAAAAGGGYGGPIFYQWQHNSGAGWIDVAGANGPTLTIPLVQFTHAGDYQCFVSIPGVCESSQSAHLDVILDPTEGVPAGIVSVGSIDGSKIGVCFTEPINDPSATDKTKYSIDGGAFGDNITQVQMRPNHASVVIVLTAPVAGAFTVHAVGVMDNEGLPSDTTASGTVQGLMDENIGTPNDPAGSAFSCGLGNIEITVGGDDYWGTVDHCHFDYAARTGDFDLKVRVSNMTYANSGWSKAGLVARVDPVANNVPEVATYASHNNNAPEGQIETPVRYQVDGALGGPLPGGNDIGQPRPPATSNPYLRMERVGDEIIVSHSPDGVAWTVHADTGATLCGVLPPTLYVGTFATANNGNSGVNLIATLEDFSLSAEGVVLSSGGLSVTPAAAGKVTIAWPPCTTLQVSDTLGATAVWTPVTGTSPLSVTVDPTKNQFYRTVR